MSKRLFENRDDAEKPLTKRRVSTRKKISNKSSLRLHLLSCGYIRNYLTSRKMNPADIAHIVVIFLLNDWEFDYWYDYEHRGSEIQIKILVSKILG